MKEVFNGLENNHGIGELSEGLKGCSNKMAQWNTCNRLDLCVEIRMKHEELRRVSAIIQPGVWRDVCKVEDESDKLLEQDELYWKQRSRENWLKSCDRNSRKRNTIWGLFDSSNWWIDNKQEVAGIIVDYFLELFRLTSLSTHDLELVLECVEPCPSTNKRAYLDTNFLAKEVWKVIFDMLPTKALKPDGLPAFFYLKFWPTIGCKVTEVCLGVRNEGLGLEEINKTLVTRIPKVPDAAGYGENKNDHFVEP
ncbi:hypothetical protein Ddye_017109 [Dipteronia dyeriana]|uniref:Uncharacterized protein n=1 Tax=Dipteronia dyeriana TaxID=168575 RepID=A0AAD9X166_9ROSI|nr:hypothetical protein Ddye_017109 [Dipteronia dyeriana]